MAFATLSCASHSGGPLRPACQTSPWNLSISHLLLTGLYGITIAPLLHTALRVRAKTDARLTSHTHLCWLPWKLSLLDLARRPPSHVPRPCAPLSNNPIRRLYEVNLSPRSARAGSDASPYRILAARPIRPLCGRCLRSSYL